MPKPPEPSRCDRSQFAAVDAYGNGCTGSVAVSVPKNQGVDGAAVDDGIDYDSTQGGSVDGVSARGAAGAPREDAGNRVFLPAIR